MVKAERKLREAVAVLEQAGYSVNVTQTWRYTEPCGHSVMVVKLREPKKRKIRRRRATQ